MPNANLVGYEDVEKMMMIGQVKKHFIIGDEINIDNYRFAIEVIIFVTDVVFT